MKASTLICAFVLTGLSGNGKSIDLFYQVLELLDVVSFNVLVVKILIVQWIQL